jgi:hypothetical protein
MSYERWQTVSFTMDCKGCGEQELIVTCDVKEWTEKRPVGTETIGEIVDTSVSYNHPCLCGVDPWIDDDAIWLEIERLAWEGVRDDAWEYEPYTY